jgi:hypothetical protein
MYGRLREEAEAGRAELNGAGGGMDLGAGKSLDRGVRGGDPGDGLELSSGVGSGIPGQFVA